jgi:formylmethanofuran dehydrogenase subunit A
MLANSASVRILIKGGKVVNDDCTHEADVYIENGIIQQVGRELMIPGGAKVIDATGKLVIPGGIDTSTHFHQTFMNATCVDDFYHGTKVMLLCANSGFIFASLFCFWAAPDETVGMGAATVLLPEEGYLWRLLWQLA